MGPARSAGKLPRGIVVCLCVGTILTISAPVVEANPSVRWQPTRFLLQSGETVDAEAGTLRVPESRTGRSRRQLRLALVRFRATAGGAGPPVVLLEGGPGSSGLAQARGRRYELIELLRRYGDVIVLDQRGTGASTPDLSCAQQTDVPAEQELTRERWVDAVTAAAATCAAAHESAGVDLPSYNTWESADDLDDLREALGVDRLVLWGQSYGTLLALTYARRHPGAVARLILHGVLGPDHFVALPRTTDRILRGLGKAAQQAGRPGLVPMLREVLERLETAPAAFTVVDPATGERAEYRLGAQELRFIVNFVILGTRDLMASLPGQVEAMHGGEFGAMAPMGLVLRRWQPFALRMAVVCSNSVTDRRQRKADAQAGGALLGGLPSMAELCAPWRVDPLGGDNFELPRIDAPALLISGTLDSVTPPGNASVVGRRLGNAQYLTIVGGTHSDLVHSDPRILEAIDDFLAGGGPSIRRIALDPWAFR